MEQTFLTTIEDFSYDISWEECLFQNDLAFIGQNHNAADTAERTAYRNHCAQVAGVDYNPSIPHSRAVWMGWMMTLQRGQQSCLEAATLLDNALADLGEFIYE